MMTQSRAMLCALAAFFVWVCYDTLVKIGMGHAGVSALTVMAIAGTIGTAGVLASAIVTRNICKLKPKHYSGLAIICVCTIGTRFANINAVKYLPLTVFYTMVFASPLVIAAISAALKHERLTRTKIACLIAGFAGVLVAVVPRIAAGGEPIGYIAALTSVLFFAIYTVTMRKTAQTETIESIQLFNFLAIALFGISGELLRPAQMPSLNAFGILVVAGLFFTLGNILFNNALKHTSSSNVAQLHYTQIISGALFGYLIWHDIPSLNLIAGSALIIASGIIVARQARKIEVQG